jgi:hypothetical protein
VYATAAGDISEWLPAGFWSDGFDGKDQIIIASVASTVLIPLVIALAVICAAKGAIACLRASRVG